MTNNEGRFSKGNRRKRLLAGLLAALVAGLFLVGCGDSDSANYFTVAFDVDGGYPVQETQLVPRGQTATPPGEVTRGEESLIGWVDTQTDETFDFSTPIQQNYQLRARFSHEGWTITFNTAGGDPISPMTGLQHGYPVTNLPTPSRGGYVFQHWIDQDGFIFTNATLVTRNKTLTASWNPEAGTDPGPGDGTGPGDAPPVVLRTVTFNPNGGTAVSPAATRNVADGTAVGGLPTTSRTGYTLAGWFTAQTGGVQVTPSTPITANVTFWARWNPRFNNWSTRLQNPQPSQWGGTANINDVAFGSNHFIAVGDGGRMAISTDGHNWTMLTNSFPAGHPIHAIAFYSGFGGWFIAGGGGGNMLRFSISGNTISSQQLFSPGTAAGQSGFAANEAIRGIAAGMLPGQTLGAWVAVGDNGRISRMTTGAVAGGFSRQTSPTTAQLNDVAFGSFQTGGNWHAAFVAVGNNGNMVRSTSTTATPGGTWDVVGASGFNTNQHIQGIAFGNGRFIAVGGSNPNVTSHAGITAAGWTSGTAGAFPLYSVAFGDGVWFIGGGGPARLMRSIDNGINWVQPNFIGTNSFSPPGTNHLVRGITFGAGRFVAVAGTQLRTGWAAE